MNRILLFQIVIVVLGALLLWLFKAPQGIGSFVAGGALIAGNFLLLGSVLKFIFKKKLIALMVLVIVFKYAILGIIIYLLMKQSWLIPFWFAAGVSSMMFGSLIYGLTLGFFKEE
jgi:hypothetical protein